MATQQEDDKQQLVEKQEDQEQQKSSGNRFSIGIDIDLNDVAIWKVLIFEFFGTMIFAHGIVSSQGSDFLIAASLFAALIFSCQHSNGHINPAVSTGFLCLSKDDLQGKHIKVGAWFAYVIAQMLGAFVGGYLALFVLGESTAPWIPKQELNWMIADILGEFIGTFFFVLVILIMTDDRTTYNHQTIYKLATICIALFFGRQFTVHSGGCLNPAIALGLETMMWLHDGDIKYLRRAYVFVIGPICGAVAAGCFFRYYWLQKKIEEKKQEENKQVEENQE